MAKKINNAFLNLNGLDYNILSDPITLNDNATEQVAFSVPSTKKFYTLEYSIERGGNTRVGRILITHNGTDASMNDVYGDTSELGVAFDVVLSGGQLSLIYTTTNTNQNASFRYDIKSWQ